LSDLKRWADRDSIELTTVSPVRISGDAVSSSRIRDLLEKGDVTDANELLVFPYRVEGQVEQGQRRGEELGFPTANLGGVCTLIPQDGVYAGVATIASGARHGAAIHVGKNLTFGAANKTIEVHLLGFSGDLYGQVLQVEFFQRIRATEKFEGVDALTKQLHADVTQIESLSQLNLEKPQVQRVSVSSASFSG
jgi:riboflavin kinase/FMN adenylyltransferase